LNNLFIRALSPPIGAALLLLAAAPPARTQSAPLPPSSLSSPSLASAPTTNSTPALPSAPDPATPASLPADHPVEPYPTNFFYLPFSRVGIGGDVSPLGIGVKGALLLNTVFDARLMQNFFSYSSGRFELSNVNVNASLRLRSTAAAFDWYPFRSVWRFSAGALFLNGNQIAGTTRIASGTSFKLNGQTFYSADPTKVPGAAPITGSGLLGIHTHNPALTLSGGFGRFIPRSERHWSFPSEFGVAFTGPPTVNLNMDGWACLDQKETQCGNVSDASNPVAIQFNNAVQTRLTKLRQSLNSIQIYPLFSYSAVYSFDIRTPRAPR
jgi:hypothetical protein